jgi:formylglycine-generating enzyme required for sulfatase activity
MITEQGTKQPRSEQYLAAVGKLHPAEVRAILNGICDAGLARPLDRQMAVWELSHDFVAHAVARALGRLRRQALQRVSAYAASALLAISLLGGLWLMRPYLEERMNWFFIMQPYMEDHVRPFVLKPDVEHALNPRDSFRECDKEKNCPEMIVVPSGEFMMGSPEGEKGPYNNEGPQHRVIIAQPFAVSKFEVTFEQWDACVAVGGCADVSDNGAGRGTQPVTNVSWYDARRYVTWFSNMTGRA